MKRETTITHSVLNRMNYSNPTLVATWRDRFPKEQPNSKPSSAAEAKSTEAIESKASTKRAESTSFNGVVVETKTAAKQAKQDKKKAAGVKPMGNTPLVFTCKDNPSDFDRIAFVIRATSKDNTRPYLQVVHIESAKTGCRLVGTDGKRLHSAEITQMIPSGDYKPVMTKDTIGLAPLDYAVQFPNWQRIVPTNTTMKGVIDLERTGFGRDEKLTENLAIAFNALTKQTGETINLRYLEDLPKKTWEIHTQNTRGKPIMLRQRGAEKAVFAVIMPLSPDHVDSVCKARAA